METGEYILLFDRDCGICSALSRWIGAADLRHRIRVRTIQSSRELLRGIPDERMLDAFHIVAPSGQLTTGGDAVPTLIEGVEHALDRKSTRLNSSHPSISYAVFCLKKKKNSVKHTTPSTAVY